MPDSSRPTPLANLRDLFGSRLQENVMLANYTTAHVGGMVDALLVANSAPELESTVQSLWNLSVPVVVLGNGSNVLFSDSGWQGVVVINRAKNIRIDANGSEKSVWAESGANLGLLSRQVAVRGLSGMEWAATIPGSVGGAVYGNAGAHNGDMAHSLLLAEILHHSEGKVHWTAEEMQYTYRSSRLKHNQEQAIVLSARMDLQPSSRMEVQEKIDQFTAQRRSTQPPGASMGSMFKNPPGDYAGRLIEAAGLKGTRVGGVEISPVHANFFVNDEGAKASDFARLIEIAQTTVSEKFGVRLELEVELLGDWNIENVVSTGKGS